MCTISVLLVFFYRKSISGYAAVVLHTQTNLQFHIIFSCHNFPSFFRSFFLSVRIGFSFVNFSSLHYFIFRPLCRFIKNIRKNFNFRSMINLVLPLRIMIRDFYKQSGRQLYSTYKKSFIIKKAVRNRIKILCTV